MAAAIVKVVSEIPGDYREERRGELCRREQESRS
jgi:hypothetical protein